MPKELINLPNWVCWGKVGFSDPKKPFNPVTGYGASANDPNTWTTYQNAVEAVGRGQYTGVGFEFSPKSGVMGIDFDHCRNAETGEIIPQVLEWLQKLDSYTEISQSGHGFHVLIRGKKHSQILGAPNNKIPVPEWGQGFDGTVDEHGQPSSAAVEMYDEKRYFALTGDLFSNDCAINAPQALADALFVEVSNMHLRRKGTPKQGVKTSTGYANVPPPLSDEQILQLARNSKTGGRFQQLYGAGQWEGLFNSQSEADQSLCNDLAFYTTDSDQIDRLFQQSALYREDKWGVQHFSDGRTYGQATIQKALADTHNHYNGGRPTPEEAFKPLNGDYAGPLNWDGTLEDDGKKRLKIISARELAVKEIPPIQWVVVDLIPHGLSILVGPSKFGKSWFVLDMCLSIASGTSFLTFNTKKSGCLYLALEDTEARLKNRMLKVLNGKEPPEHFDYSTSSSTIGTGLLEELEDYVVNHPDTGMIVIDTLQKVRDSGKSGDTSYTYDYREMGFLKQFADKFHVSLLLVHHTRKMEDASDDFNKISGSTGIMGAADTILMMKRETRQSDITSLLITGRDIGSNDLRMRFDKDLWKWKFLGSAEQFEQQRALTEYNNDPVVYTIRALLEEKPDGWSGSAKDFLTFGEQKLGYKPAPTSQKLNKRLGDLEQTLKFNDGIIHRQTPHGNAGDRHWFYKGKEPLSV